MKKTTYIFNVLSLLISIIAVYFSYSAMNNERLAGIRDVAVESAVYEGKERKQEDIDAEKEKKNMVGAPNADIIKNLGSLMEVDGGIYFNTSVEIPPCEDSVRGVIWFMKNTDTSDELLMCTKIKDGSFIWRII